ncbi:MAG: EAL domain-containing protein, partial [Parafilimonas terrae]|nr:EAL domain-containing protein [Parafilimonas terrae]
PFDKIKVDRSFVSDIGRKPQSAAIVRTILGLGKALAIPVLAEGVENEGERVFLKDAGCTEFQGYLLGRPQPIASFSGLTGHGGEPLPRQASAAGGTAAA